MSQATASTAAVRLPARLFWIPILIIDVILLATLPYAAAVTAGLLAVLGLVILLSRPRAALAFSAAGLPLLDRVSHLLGSEKPVWHLGWIMIVLVLAMRLWGALWDAHAGPTRHRGRAVIFDPVVLSGAALGIVLTVGLLYTQSPVYGFMKVQFYLLVNLLLLLGAAWTLRPATSAGSEESLSTAARSFLIPLTLWQVLIACVAGINWFVKFDPFPVRLSALGITTIWLARHMGMGILLVLALKAMGRIRWFPSVLLIGLMGWVAYSTGSRGPLVALAAALMVWFALGGGTAERDDAGRTRSPMIRRLAVLLMIAAPVLLLVLASERLVEGRALSNLVRSRILDMAMDAFRQSGLWGLGTGGFSQLFSIGDQRFYPHNIFLELYLENGLPGLVIWLGFLIVLLGRWTGWRKRLAGHQGSQVERILLRLVAAQFVFHMVNAQFSGDIFVNQWIWLWAGVLVAWAPRGRA